MVFDSMVICVANASFRDEKTDFLRAGLTLESESPLFFSPFSPSDMRLGRSRVPDHLLSEKQHAYYITYESCSLSTELYSLAQYKPEELPLKTSKNSPIYQDY